MKLGLNALLEVADAVLDDAENEEELDAIAGAMLGMAASNAMGDAMKNGHADLNAAKKTWLRTCEEAWNAAEQNIQELETSGATAPGGRA